MLAARWQSQVHRLVPGLLVAGMILALASGLQAETTAAPASATLLRPAPAGGGAAVKTPVVRISTVWFEPVPDEASRVIIVANANDADSVELARYYADRRSIPRANIVALDLPAGEEIGWPDYVNRLHRPLQDWLVAHGWVEAMVMNQDDDAGRRRLLVSHNRLSYLVTCRGVPLKIRHGNEFPADGPANARDTFKTSHAAVDSELSVLLQNNPQRYGFVPNGLFRKDRPMMWDRDAVVKVARLDGPTYPAARNLVDSAMTAERQGLIGRAIVDLGGPYKKGDEWFEATAARLTVAGWTPQVDRARATLAATAPADAVALYFGWYAGSINGPFALPGYQFAPGAVALHLHSFSATSLRSMNSGGWCGPLVARGVAATFGNVYEPYLEFTHEPQLIVQALMAGATLGEAAYFAMPVLSWQSLVLGDPLYRPFTTGMPEAWEQRLTLPRRLASYVALRRLTDPNLPPSDDRIEAAESAMREYPSLALALALARLHDEGGDRSAALRDLGVAAYLTNVRADEWGLMSEVARQLAEWNAGADAVKVWQTLLKQALPDAVRLTWLREAVPIAKSAGQPSLVTDWEREITRLTPPAESPAKK